jgi:hypothetical protein
MIGFVTWLSRLCRGAGEQAGFGQSLLEDLRFLTRFLRCRKMRVQWRPPSSAERLAVETHETVARFGDDTIAVAYVEGRQWIVRERDWFGWPDAPRYVLFILSDGLIWTARDFNAWPTNWHLLHLDTSSLGGIKAHAGGDNF